MLWWSATGACRQLVDAAAAGAADEPGTETVVMRCDQARAADVLAASGLLVVAPENLASLAGMMKDFFDRTYYEVLGHVEGRPYATIIAAGSDGWGAVRQVDRIFTGWRMRRIAEPQIALVHAQTPEAIAAPKQVHSEPLARARELGAAFAAGLALSIW